MPGPSGREPPISYRPPQALREEFLARVEKSGLTASGFITASIFGTDAPRQARRPGVAQQELARLLAECARMRTALEARPAGDPHAGAQLDEAVRTLQDIRNALLLAGGRAP